MAVLHKHKDWREAVIASGNPFPDACGDWAAADGCTRLVLETDGCVKTGDLPEEYDIMFNVNVKTRSNKVKNCINKIPGAKDQSDQLSIVTTNLNAYFYVTFQSTLFGFIDDMFIELKPSGSLSVPIDTLKIQS